MASLNMGTMLRPNGTAWINQSELERFAQEWKTGHQSRKGSLPPRTAQRDEELHRQGSFRNVLFNFRVEHVLQGAAEGNLQNLVSLIRFA